MEKRKGKEGKTIVKMENEKYKDNVMRKRAELWKK